MFSCTRFETKMIMEGKAVGICRMGNPGSHIPGEVIALTSKYLDQSGREIPFCKAKLITVRPGTFYEFRTDPSIAQMDGYSNVGVWQDNMEILYNALSDGDEMYHIKFVLEELDKEAGRRGDIPVDVPQNDNLQQVDMDDDGIVTKYVSKIN